MLGASTPPVAAADQMLSLHVLHACSRSDNEHGSAVRSQQVQVKGSRKCISDAGCMGWREITEEAGRGSQATAAKG